MKKNLFAIVALLICTSLSAQNTPNIIYILADDLGYGDLSSLNKNSKIKTIHLDQLAAAGMVFTDAHTSSSVCTPSRYSILTGRYNWRTSLQDGVLWSYDPPLIAKERVTVASLLKKNGYHTAAIGKWHLGLGWQKDATGNVDLMKTILDGPTSHGFDYFYGITASLDIPPYVYIENNKVTATAIDSIAASPGPAFWREGPIGNDFKHAEVLPHLTQKAVDYIGEQQKGKKPFFLYFALPSPHTPILPTADYIGKTGTTPYGDFVLMTDAVVGQLVQAVEKAGLTQNTLIIFTSDNGAAPAANLEQLKQKGHLANYIFRGNKADIYEGGHRVPFIAKWPAMIRAGAVSEATISLTDFMATAAALTDQKLAANEGEDSFSLLPLFKGAKGYQRKYTILHSISGNFSIRHANWKLAFSYGSGGWSAPDESKAKQLNMPAVQLYNLSADISENNNLKTKYPSMVEKMTKELNRIIDQGRSTPGPKVNNDVTVDYEKYL